MQDSFLRRARASLKFRIAAIIFLLEAVMMTAVLGVTLDYTRSEVEKHLAANEQVMLQLLGNLSRIALLTSEYDELQPYMEEVVKDPHVRTVLLADRRGRVVVSNEHAYIGNPLPNFEKSENLRWLSREVVNAGGRIGTLAIHFSHENVAQTGREVLNLGITIALTGMILIAIVGILIGHLLTRRLDALAQAAQRLADGDLAVRTNLAGLDEVAIVGRAFDTMARSIADNVEALKRATDLLEQRVAERTRELAEARDDAIAANHSKSAFLANMSHEIRTPLTAIIGFSESLLDTNQPVAERIDSIRTIINGGKHLLRIINDVLDVSKVEAGKLEVEQLPVNPFEVLDGMRALVALLAEEKGLLFETEYIYPLPARITSDALRIKQILINLCNNAIKFTSRGSVRIKVSCDREQQLLTFKVLDTGIGMSAGQIDGLFMPFVQADASTTRQYGGSGLGLYLSRQLAMRLGGDITVESTPDVGSCFTLSVATGPLHDRDFVTRMPASVQAPLAPNDVWVDGQVLLADDNLDNQKLIALLLRRVGAEVAIANNGRTALEAARTGNFDLVLMDMQMPVMNGLDATRTLRREGYRGTIIALTANVTREDIDACLSAGCDEYMSKPIDRQKLEAVLLRHLRTGKRPPAARMPIASRLLEQDPDFIDIVSEFVDRLPVTVRSIEETFQAGDYPKLGQLVHALKGTAGNFGYPEVHHLCQVVEFEIAKGNTPGIGKLLTELGRMTELIGQGLPRSTPGIARGA